MNSVDSEDQEKKGPLSFSNPFSKKDEVLTSQDSVNQNKSQFGTSESTVGTPLSSKSEVTTSENNEKKSGNSMNDLDLDVPAFLRNIS